MGKKKGNKKPADDDDALLDAAIADNTRMKEQAEAAAAAFQSDDVPTVWGGTLTHQEVVEKLDAVPVFHVVVAESKAMVPTEDDLGISGDASGCWYFDHEDAQRALDELKAANPQLVLELETTPLGTAFALSEGWQQVPENTLLRLQASRAALASLPEPPEQLPEALRERFNSRTGPIPLLAIQSFKSRGKTPFFFGATDLAMTWMRETGKPQAEMPDITVVDLRLIVARMLSDESSSWQGLSFCADRKSMEFAAQLHTRDVANGDEPPPLDADDAPPPLEG